MKTFLAPAVCACVVVLLIAASGTGSPTPAEDRAGPAIVRAAFTADGRAILPTGYRHWSHVGTRYKPDGINILDLMPAKTPEILNAYVEESARASFETTGQWPDGTQIVKEFSAVRLGEACDKTGICNGRVGRGIFQAGYIGLGMMIKDAKRFPASPGHWGYFNFGHKPQPYDATAAAMPTDRCEACHAGFAADTDYVVTGEHIGLARRNK